MNLKFVDILNGISMFQLVLFVFFLLGKSKNRTSNLLLAAFFLTQFLSIADHFISSQKLFFQEISPMLFYLGLPFPWLWSPLFYLYVKSLFFSDFRFSSKHLLHFIPFFLFLQYVLVAFHFKGMEEKMTMIRHNQLLTAQSSLWLNILISLQIAIYLVVVLVLYHNYQKRLKGVQSNISPVQDRWVKIFIFGYLAAYLVTILCRAGLYLHHQLGELFIFTSFLAFFLYFLLLFYKAITHPDIFMKTEERPEARTNTIPKQEAHSLLKVVHDYMIQREPFLNPDLSLKQLASELKIPERLLSGVINQYRNQNFYDFVNSYRISKAQRMLTDDTFKRKTVLEILYDSGFNSKSSFNQVFKKITGLTPTEFKRTQR